MNTKYFLAVLAITGVFFFGGWGLSGLILMDYFQAHTSEGARALMATAGMKLWAVGLANLCYGILIAWVIQRSGSPTWMSGMRAGAWIAFLMAVSFNLFLIGFMDMYDFGVIVVAGIENAILGGIAGAAAGAILGSGRKAS